MAALSTGTPFKVNSRRDQEIVLETNDFSLDE